MKALRYIFFLIVLISSILRVHSQESNAVLHPTPEQEAAKQTEKLQQELNLNQEQSKKIFEINLKYARERQISNTRTEAIDRMKNKNADIEQVLNQDQNYKLRTKRYDRTTYQSPSTNRNMPENASGYRSTSPGYRPNPTQLTPSTDNSLRNSYRSSSPEIQSIRKSSVPSRAPQLDNNQPTQRSTGSDYSTPKRTETVTPSFPQSSSPSRQNATVTTPERKVTTPTPTRR